MTEYGHHITSLQKSALLSRDRVQEDKERWRKVLEEVEAVGQH